MNELKEAKIALLQYIINEAEENKDGVYDSYDGTDGTTTFYGVGFENAFDSARDDQVEDIFTWASDYGLTFDEQDELKRWIYTVHANSSETTLNELKED